MDAVIKEFSALNKIPRSSGHEEAVAQYLTEQGLAMGYTTIKDEANNVIIEVPAAKGYEDVPLVIIQAHMDMVCVGDVDFDPLCDPIITESDGKTMWAKGTSLGADNGIGVGMMLALMKEQGEYGRLRLIFTADEEVGMGGAKALDDKYLAEKYLINLDWEDISSLCIGCASCGDAVYRKTMAKKEMKGACLSVSIGGLMGGHSGCEIHENRANAIHMIGEILHTLTEAGIPFSLTELKGGKAMNVIAPEASFSFVVSKTDEEAAKASIRVAAANIKSAFLQEKGFFMVLKTVAAPKYGCLEGDSRDVASFLKAFPQGVVEMSKEMQGFVSTSCNLGTILLEGDYLSVVTSFRSDEASKEAALMERCRDLGAANGFTTEKEIPGIPWTPKPGSDLEKTAVEVYAALGYGKVSIETIHAGLEGAMFAQKNPDLQILSLGPTMEQCHSVKEVLYLDTVPLAMEWLRGILKKIK